MGLDNNFRRAVEDTIKSWLPLAPIIKQGDPKPQQIWKYEHESDFLYGMLIGEIHGDVHRLFKTIYNRAPSQEEGNEIKEIIESNAKELRTALYKN